jgi:hypothetical protein
MSGFPGIDAGAPIGRPAAARPQDSQQLPYHLQLRGRDSTGGYSWVGRVHGETRGQANVRVAFEDKPAPHPGFAPVRARWVVRASPASDSFEARLAGTIEMVTGETRLSGVVTTGARRGQRVEASGRLLNFGPNETLTDAVGMMTISAPKSASGALPPADVVSRGIRP